MVEAGCRRRQQQFHAANAQGLVGAFEEKLDLWPLDVAVQDHAKRAVGCLPASRHDVERAVAVSVALARQTQLRRIELHAAEADDAVGASLKPRLDPREPAGEAGKETVVPTTNPGLS